MTLRLRVLAPGETVHAADDVAWVRLRLADGGLLSVWPRHAPLLAETLPGPLSYAGAEEETSLHVAAAILTVRDDAVTLLTAGGHGEPAERQPQADPAFDRLARELMDRMRNPAPGSER